MPVWTVAGVQMDCRLARPVENLGAIRAKLAEAARAGARLVVFPECAVTGYAFTTRAEAASVAETIPGPSTDAIAGECARHGVWAIFGLLEAAGSKLFNACAIVGPTGQLAVYRKLHLPCLGADRFTDPGDRPFAVHDLGGLRVGVHICFDGSYPESARVLSLLGADLIVQPTNWADQAIKNATLVARVRAFENHVYHMAVNRVGVEGGYHFVGHSSIVNCVGDFLTLADHDEEAIVLADIDPDKARQKRAVYCAGEYEIDRVNWRRPEMYGPLVEPSPAPFIGHQNRD
ncbi:carbon-nitrogen hydrolase family protein [Fimbriiglobus ruber]|uniref:N-carbamoylputrescine amidase n=1 Tax=Fimbriiglobus ruber TaxID=1908690 RepID=A0A225CYP9_9BACT|nr:carbon-nitrogen hydrolase family protein [Fimbriiglobus ruber]OWK34471.1 N-carbamoylputrescine amidase [Fimbriiglobus ruber]